MKAIELVAPFEDCLKYKKLGFSQDTFFCWVETKTQLPLKKVVPMTTIRNGVYKHQYLQLCAAPTAKELLLQLPDFIDNGNTYELKITKVGGVFCAQYWSDEYGQLWRTDNPNLEQALMYLFFVTHKK